MILRDVTGPQQGSRIAVIVQWRIQGGGGGGGVGGVRTPPSDPMMNKIKYQYH